MNFDEFYPDLKSTAGAACEKDDPDLLLKLIEAGKSVVSADSRGWQPIHVAAQKSFKCLTILLNRGKSMCKSIKVPIWIDLKYIKIFPFFLLQKTPTLRLKHMMATPLCC